MNWAAALRNNPVGLISTLRTAPDADLISVDDMKDHMRVTGGDDDELIGALISAATDHLDAHQGVLGRALVNQTWRASYAAAPTDLLVLPVPPVASITSVYYLDIDGAEQTFAAENYDLLKDDNYGALELKTGAAWPSVQGGRRAAFWVDYVAGYGASGDNVPKGILQAARLLTAHWYENREAVLVGVSGAELPIGVQALIAAHRHPRTLF